MPRRSDALDVQFPSSLVDNTLVAFKTHKEKEINIGREYNYEPMDIGQCLAVVNEEGIHAGGAKEGEVIFMRQGPFNMLPYVKHFERLNKEKHGGNLENIMTRPGLTDRQ